MMVSVATFDDEEVTIEITRRTPHQKGQEKVIYVTEVGKIPAGFVPQVGAIINLIGGEPGVKGPHILKANGSAKSFYLEPTVGGKTRGSKVRVRTTDVK